MPLRDLGYAARTLRKSPALAATAIATIALGIGASTAIFSVTNSVLLRPLPYKNADRLVLVCRDFKKSSAKDVPFADADFFDLRDGTRNVFEDIAAVFTFRAFVPRQDGSAEQISKAQVTTNFFRMMGAKVAFGRDFLDADARPQPHDSAVTLPTGNVAILSYQYWQRSYGGSTAVIGHELRSSGHRGPQIVGVLAPGFRLFFPASTNTDAAPDVWIANNDGYDNDRRDFVTQRVIGLLKGRVTIQGAQEQIGFVEAQLRNKVSWFAYQEMHLRLEPMGAYLVAEARPAILALMGAVIFLLLIACANVANLLLVRASLRERELAVRTALGAPTWRLVRQLLAESVLLSGAGSLIGLGFAWLGIHELLVFAPGNLPRLESTSIDWRVLTFAAISGLAAAAAFGVIPALRAARPDVVEVLSSGSRTATLGRGHWLRSGLVIAEVALSFVLLTGSGLMFRSFLELRRIDPGYNPQGVLTFFLSREWPLSRQQGRQALLHEIQARLGVLPGVKSATAALSLPLTGAGPPANRGSDSVRPIPASAEEADFQAVLPGYFETLRTPLLAGRTFTDQDNAPGRKVVVINQFLAARAYPHESAVGKRILTPHLEQPWMEVIGVVAHQRSFSLADPGRETFYIADGFDGIGVSRYWAVRVVGDPAKYQAAVRSEIASIDRQLVISKMQPMQALVDRDQAGTRFQLLLIGMFAVIAALLAAVGIYGVLSTEVRQRTAEIGVRVALGAEPARILSLVVGHGLRLSASGIAIGFYAALGFTRVMASMLVGVKATDPATFGVMAVVFFLIAAFASWLPARRAAALDPTEALREQ